VERWVQFHFGDTREMDRYSFGDAVRLKPSDPSRGHLLVGGWPEPCPQCGADFSRDEEIVTVEILDGRLIRTRESSSTELGLFLRHRVVTLED
jgi:hypothetical protein